MMMVINSPLVQSQSHERHPWTVTPGDPVFVDARGELKDVDRENQKRRKDEGLEEAFGGFAFGPSAVLRRELPAQYQPEDHQAINKTDQREAKMNPGEIARLLIAVGRQGVLRDSLRWRLRGCRRRGRGRCLLHER